MNQNGSKKRPKNREKGHWVSLRESLESEETQLSTEKLGCLGSYAMRIHSLSLSAPTPVLPPSCPCHQYNSHTISIM